jgi:hypothetical protein
VKSRPVLPILAVVIDIVVTGTNAELKIHFRDSGISSSDCRTHDHPRDIPVLETMWEPDVRMNRFISCTRRR